MSRYMPLTDVDHPIPTILIDTHAPLDALHATADYRIRIVTQLLETLTSKERTCNDLNEPHERQDTVSPLR